MRDFHTQPEATALRKHTPTPWELIEATEHHGAYVVNSWGRTVCDLYAMSNPMSASVRNGGNSYPVHFDDMEANAAFIVKAVNSHAAFKQALEEISELGDVRADEASMIARRALAMSLEDRK